MTKKGKYAKRLEARLRAALERLRDDDVRSMVHAAFRSWWAGRRSPQVVKPRPPAKRHKVTELSRRLAAAADRMRLDDRRQEARDLVRRWCRWRQRCRRRRQDLKEQRRAAAAKRLWLERERREQQEREDRRRRARKDYQRRAAARRREELIKARPNEVKAWRRAWAQAERAAPVPEVILEFVARWPPQKLRWNSDDRHAAALPAWKATCRLYHLTAYGESRHQAVERLERLIARHEAEGPAGDDVPLRRLFRHPPPHSFTPFAVPAEGVD
jgi:hypothetical protein